MKKQPSRAGKLVAPVVIAVLLTAYYIAFAVICVCLPAALPLAVKLILGVAPLALAGVCVAMLVERIKEIRSGEEDDLSQY